MITDVVNQIRNRVYFDAAGSYYDPETGLARLVPGARSEEDRQPPPTLRHWKLITQHVVHELTHWCQWQSTTIGLFAQALRESMDNMTIGGLRSLETRTKRHALEARRVGVSPLIRVEVKDGLLQTSFEDDWSPDRLPIKAAWSERFKANYAMIYAPISAAWKPEVARLIAKTAFEIAQTFGAIHSTCGSSLPRQALSTAKQYACSEMAKSVERRSFPDVSGVSISTFSLMEAQAVANDILFSAGLDNAIGSSVNGKFEPHDQKMTDRRVAALSETFYLAPFRHMLVEMGFALEKENIVRIAPAIAVAVDLSLNPPLPPGSTRTSFDFADVFPPARFHRVVQAVREVGELSSEAYMELERRSEYKRKLSVKSGVKTEKAGVQTVRADIDRVFRGWIDTGAQPDRRTLARLTLYCWKAWVWDVARREKIGSDDLYERIKNNAQLIAALGPQAVIKGATLSYREGLPVGLVDWTLSEAASSYALFDIMAGHGEVKDITPPSLEIEPELRTRLEAHTLAKIGGLGLIDPSECRRFLF